MDLSRHISGHASHGLPAMLSSHRINSLHLFAVAGIGLALTACEKRDQAATSYERSENNISETTIAQQAKPESRLPQSRASQPETAAAESVDALVADCRRLMDEDASFSELKEAYAKLAMADPALALEHVGDPAIFNKIGGPIFPSLLEVVAKNNPDMLVQLLDQGFPRYENKDLAISLTSMTLDVLAKQHPEKAVAAFNHLDIPEDQKQSVISALFRGLAKNDPSTIIAKASNLDPTLASHALAGAVVGATDRDPQMAKLIAEAITNRESRLDAINGVFAEWLKQDPAVAKAELMKMDSKAMEDLLVDGARKSVSTHYTLSQKDPLTLLSLLDGIYPTAANKWLFESSVMATVKTQPEQTFSTISKLPEGELKSHLFGRAYSTLAHENPEQALELFSREKDPASRAIALPQVASSIGLTGMDATLRFVNGLGSDEEKSEAFSAAFNAITHKDVDSAAGYLESASSQPVQLSVQERERGYKVVGYLLQGKNPQEAREWMYKLPPAEQPHAMFGIASQMAERDAKGLGEFLNTLKKDHVWASGVEVMISTVEATDARMANQWKQALKEADLKSR